MIVPKLYRLLFFALIFFSFNKSFAQNQRQLDSLLSLLNEKNRDTIQLNVNRAIGDAYLYNNYTKAITYFEVARDLALELKKKKSVADNYYSIGYCYLGKSDFDNALDNYLNAVKLYEEVNDKRCVANSYMSIASVQVEAKNSKSALTYLNLSENIIKERNDSNQLVGFYNLKSKYFFEQSIYDSALLYSKKTIVVAKKINDNYSTISSYVALALNYKKKHNNIIALKFIDSALTSTFGDVNMLDSYAAILNNKASIYADMGEYSLAKKYFSESLEVGKKSGSKIVELENYKNLASMYETMHDYKAQANFLQKYYNLKDSIFTIENTNKLIQLETDYQLGKKNLELIKKDASIKEQKSKAQIYSIAILAILILFGGFIIYLYTIQKKKKIVEQKNSLISKQKDDLQNLNHVKDRLFSIISHDLRNPLNTLRSYLLLSDNDSISLEKKALFKKQTMSAVTMTGNLLDNLLTWANLQIKDTKPVVIPVSIEENVQDVVDIVHAQALLKNINIEINISDIYVATDKDIFALALRNILTNAIKFSDSNKHIYIESRLQGEEIVLSIKDEGIGMIEQQIQDILNKKNKNTIGTSGETGNGLGLFLVVELLKKINATLTIDSELGLGSTFNIHLTKM